MSGLMLSMSTTSASTAVIRPPTNSTSPVPIRFRMPSTSFMMRDTSVAGLVGVVVGHRQPADVRLHLAAQLGDQALRRLREELGERERGDALDRASPPPPPRTSGTQQLGLPLADDVVDQELGGGRQDEAGQAVNDHERAAHEQQPAARRDQGPDVGPERAQAFGARRAPCLSRRRRGHRGILARAGRRPLTARRSPPRSQLPCREVSGRTVLLSAAASGAAVDIGALAVSGVGVAGMRPATVVVPPVAPVVPPVVVPATALPPVVPGALPAAAPPIVPAVLPAPVPPPGAGVFAAAEPPIVAPADPPSARGGGLAIARAVGAAGEPPAATPAPTPPVVDPATVVPVFTPGGVTQEIRTSCPVRTERRFSTAPASTSNVMIDVSSGLSVVATFRRPGCLTVIVWPKGSAETTSTVT